jgi:signal peptidase I
MLKLLRVAGNSLLPTFCDGDFVLVSKIPYLFASIRAGDIIAFRHSEYGTMIKQVDSVRLDKDEIQVVGTHVYSVDSRRFGPIHTRDVLGKVIWHIKSPVE